MTVYFDSPGKHNTEEVAGWRSNGPGIGHKPHSGSSNTGYTANFFVEKGPKVVCVTHHVGFREPDLTK